MSAKKSRNSINHCFLVCTPARKWDAAFPSAVYVTFRCNLCGCERCCHNKLIIPLVHKPTIKKDTVFLLTNTLHQPISILVHLAAFLLCVHTWALLTAQLGRGAKADWPHAHTSPLALSVGGSHLPCVCGSRPGLVTDNE